MLKTNPETLNEIKAAHSVMQITKFYHTTNEFLDEVYDFFMESDKNSLLFTDNKVIFKKNSCKKFIYNHSTL